MSERDRKEAREMMGVVSNLGLRQLNRWNQPHLIFSHIVALNDVLTLCCYLCLQCLTTRDLDMKRFPASFPLLCKYKLLYDFSTLFLMPWYVRETSTLDVSKCQRKSTSELRKCNTLTLPFPSTTNWVELLDVITTAVLDSQLGIVFAMT
jgi:hypothetical protein